MQNLQELENLLLSDIKYPITYQDLLNNWEQLANDCADYKEFIYEYINDLTVRNLLQKFIDSATGKLKSKIVDEVTEIDLTFKNNTKEIAVPFIKADVVNWWELRIPQKAILEFTEDVELYQRENNTPSTTTTS